MGKSSRIIKFSVSFVAIIFCASLFAEEKSKSKTPKKTTVNFEESVIEGKVKKPYGAYIMNGSELDFKTLHIIKNKISKKIADSKEYLEGEE